MECHKDRGCVIVFPLKQVTAFCSIADSICVVTPTGAQVADLVAFGQHDLTHWLSNGRTFDYSGTIYLTQDIRCIRTAANLC